MCCVVYITYISCVTINASTICVTQDQSNKCKKKKKNTLIIIFPFLLNK